MAAPQWKGLFEWTMKHADGTSLADMSKVQVDPEKMAWLQEVLSNYVKDLVARLREIKEALEEPENRESSLQQQEVLLDELQEIVEDIDQAKNLHLIGGVPLLRDLLQSAQSSLRSRAAEVVATCVQNNHEVQKAFFDDDVFPLAMSVALNEDALCKVKGWMAVACMVRNFQPAHQAFLDAQGLEHLLRAMDSDDPRLQRRLLLLLEYLLSHGDASHLVSLQQSRAPSRLASLLESDDIDVRERALSVLVTMAKTSDGRDKLQSHEALALVLDTWQNAWEQLTSEEKESRSQEKEHVTQLLAALKQQRE